MIAKAVGISEETVLLNAEQLAKKKEWNEENIKVLKDFILKKLEAGDIAKMMEMSLEKVKAQSEKIINPVSKPLKGSSPYKEKTEEEHPTFIPPFVRATIAIDKNDKPIKMSKPGEVSYVLYSGECSCENPSKQTANFLIIGPTGAGKTTYVDAFVNFVLGIDIFDKFRYRMVDEKHLVAERDAYMKAQGKEVSEGSAQTMSMTSSVTIYHIPAKHIVNKLNKDNCCINVIDTPGFGDTKGQAWDWKIFNMITNLL